ncbi:MAG: molecular chaperone TorD family protein [Planctomycetes bacterium]|nr:molecular chaperone TorD family protein [Planctomycetota bacterium]
MTALAQADLLLGLARAFGPPGPAATKAVADLAGVAEPLAEAAGGPDPRALADALRLAAWAVADAAPGALEMEYQRLFSCGVACPIHEAGFVRRDKGHILGDIAGFYRAFGVQLREDAAERPDHLVAELEFLALLLVMLARAEGEQAAVTRAAARAFGEDHLGEWLPGFTVHLAATTREPAYAHLARALAGAWGAVAAALGLDEPPRRLPAAGTGAGAEAGEPFECGLAEAGLA